MNEIMFQTIFDKLQDYLPRSWDSVVLYVGYTSGSYNMKFYTCIGEGNYTDCFSQEGSSRTQLRNLFINIDEVLSAERIKLKDEDKWSVFTMIVNSQGQMKTYFDYVKLDENTIAYEREWKKKYLRPY